MNDAESIRPKKAMNASKIKKYSYSLVELAERWGLEENDIINLAIDQKIHLSINLNCYQPLPLSGWWNLILPGEIAGLLPNQQSFLFGYFHDPSDESNPASFVTIKHESDGLYRKLEFFRSDIVIFSKEVERFEQKHAAMFSSVPMESCSPSEASTTASQEIFPIDSRSLHLMEEKIYKGGKEIEAAAAASGWQVLWKTIKGALESAGVTIDYEMKGKKPIPIVKKSVLLQHIEMRHLMKKIHHR